MRKTSSLKRSIAKQSDIVIHPNGEISVSFLWDDFVSSPEPALVSSRVDKSIPDALDWDENTRHEYQSCQMCPKACGFNRIKARHPRCGGQDLRIGTWGITFGDEPQIKGRRGSGAIMISQCPLTCPSCHNPEMVAGGTPVTAQEFLEICYELQSQGAHNIQILSPTVHMAKLIVLLRHLKDSQFSLPIVLKSSGVESLEYLRRLDTLVDVYLPDFKYGPRSSFAQRAGFKNYFELAQQNLTEMLRQVGVPQYAADGTLTKGVLVRHVLAPLPQEEREVLLAHLKTLQNQIVVAINPHFVNLE